ncbi:MAG: cysteine synthase family protein [Defluviitaleaceae bacterium]|nr:cysteine synthase family protein [Defluviitaleaceae bacterium]MCL2835882.1 cysteine synthase family protein [Defluviitaleaceae bacterium]
MEKYITSITQAIGGTHLLRLDKLRDIYGFDGEIYAKLEHMSPGFSKKDRIARGMIEEALLRGHLSPGKPVIETTSGNTGIGVAIVCAALGYRFICVMSRGNSQERVKMIESFGGEVVLVDQAPGSRKGFVSGEDLSFVQAETERIVRETGGFYLDQFNNPDNSKAQEEMGEEIWLQTGGEIQVFADFIGTGGTFAGVSRRLKQHNPAIKCYAVEPECCAFYAGAEITGTGHRIQGGGYGKHQMNVDKSLIDGCVQIDDDTAIKTTRGLALCEGVFGGFSSGANVAAAVSLLNGAEKGKKIAVVINDCGLKYMSAELF